MEKETEIAKDKLVEKKKKKTREVIGREHKTEYQNSLLTAIT